MKRLSRVKLLFVWMCLLLGLAGLVSACEGQSAASVVTPSIGEPRVGAPSPQQPGEEIGISIEIASTGGASLTYTWSVDGGEIVRGQGSPAITYRVPQEPGTYNIRVKVEWDGQSVEKVTSVKVEGTTTAPTSEPPTDTPQPPADTATPKPTNTPKLPTATPTPKATNISKPINTPHPTPTSIENNAQVIYANDLTNPDTWPKRSDLTVSEGKLTFTPNEFEEVWATDFSQELGDFIVSAIFDYDTQGQDYVGVAIVIGDSSTGNFFFLGANPSYGNTTWYFVMVKNWEHIHPSEDAPITSGQPKRYSVQIVRRNNQVSAYVNGKKIMTRDDIVFEGRPALMQVGVNAEGNGVSISLEELSVAIPK